MLDRPPETPLEKLTRLLGMGKYGEDLAQEILDDYVRDYMRFYHERISG